MLCTISVDNFVETMRNFVLRGRDYYGFVKLYKFKSIKKVSLIQSVSVLSKPEGGLFQLGCTQKNLNVNNVPKFRLKHTTAHQTSKSVKRFMVGSLDGCNSVSIEVQVC